VRCVTPVPPGVGNRHKKTIWAIKKHDMYSFIATLLLFTVGIFSRDVGPLTTPTSTFIQAKLHRTNETVEHILCRCSAVCECFPPHQGMIVTARGFYDPTAINESDSCNPTPNLNLASYPTDRPDFIQAKLYSKEKEERILCQCSADNNVCECFLPHPEMMLTAFGMFSC
jgi:hypothetical protein